MLSCIDYLVTLVKISFSNLQIQLEFMTEQNLNFIYKPYM